MKGERLGEFEEFTLLAVRALGDHTYAVPVQQFVEDATGRNVALERGVCSARAPRGQRLRAFLDGGGHRAAQQQSRRL